LPLSIEATFQGTAEAFQNSLANEPVLTAALLGGFLLAFGTGTGSELRRSPGISVIGGLLLSRLLILYTTPVIYLPFGRLASRFGGRSKPHAEIEPVAAEHLA
jgi:Cu/Ag efflux pump CusA